MIQDTPELRIVEDELWSAVKNRQKTVKHATPDEGDSVENHFRDRRRPKYLLSGLTKCGCCGGGYSMISAHLVGCSTRRNKGTCDNDMNIRRDALEERVLNALRHNLMELELFQEFCDEFTREMNKLRMAGRASIDAAEAEAEIKKIDRELEKILDLYLKDALSVDIPNAEQQSGDICKDVMKAWIVSLAKRQARADYESSLSPART